MSLCGGGNCLEGPARSVLDRVSVLATEVELVFIESAMECSSGTMEAHFFIVPGICGFRQCRVARSASWESRMRDSGTAPVFFLMEQTRSSTRIDPDISAYQMSHHVIGSNLWIDSSLSRILARARPEIVQESDMLVRAVLVESLPSFDSVVARASSAARQRTTTV